MLENWKEYHDEIEKLSLPELESRILELFKTLQQNCLILKKDEKLEACLSQRKYLLNKDFRFTPEIVTQIERVNRILVENRAKLLTRCQILFRQMYHLIAKGDDFLTDFYIEGTLGVGYYEDKPFFDPGFDENNGQSNYSAMAEVLQWTESDFSFASDFSFFYNEDANPDASNEELGLVDSLLEHNWNIELLDAPELNHIEYIGYASHNLFVHSKYAISDIIRTRYFESKVTVAHQNLVDTQAI